MFTEVSPCFRAVNTNKRYSLSCKNTACNKHVLTNSVLKLYDLYLLLQIIDCIFFIKLVSTFDLFSKRKMTCSTSLFFVQVGELVTDLGGKGHHNMRDRDDLAAEQVRQFLG